MKHFVAIFLFSVAASVAFGQIRSPRLLAAIAELTPAPEMVPAGREMKIAEAVAADSHHGAMVLWGIGQSMEPLYGTNTALIIERVNYEHLKKGMTVVYMKRDGHRVAHSVVGETRGGYLVQGVNNSREDDELVTDDNYVGVIVAAYSATSSRLLVGLAQVNHHPKPTTLLASR